jgi:hypothetical protein
MIRTALLVFLLSVAAFAATPLPQITATDLVPPTTAAGASGSSLSLSAEGVAWLTWLEPDGDGMALRYATLAPGAKRWSAAGTIAHGRNWFVNWADFPALTAGAAGQATAVWFVHNPPAVANTTPTADHDHHGPGYHAQFSRTTDGGRTWSPPAPLTRESDSVEFVSLATLADGRVLAAWLDGRAKKRGGKTQQLYARLLEDSGPDRLVDPSVCDCCQTSLTAFPDGTALLAYRGRTADEIRDIRVTRYRAPSWDEPRGLSADEWRINACPVNGPHLTSDGGRVAAAWFTAADNDPRVLVSFSPDAGRRFLMPLRLSETKPAGRVATVLLRDGAIIVTWVDVAGALWLRRVTPDFAATEPVLLAPAAPGRIKGFPRVALVRDYLGGKEPAQFLVSYTAEGTPALRTLLVTVPEGDLLESERNCDCAPTPDQLRGFSLRGIIQGAKQDPATLQIRHFEVPGVFAEGVREFRVAPDLAGHAVHVGRQFLGRIEKRQDAWWLFDVRLIVGPTP